MEEPIARDGPAIGVDPTTRVDALVAAAVSQIHDYAIIVLDPDGVIESWNTGAARLKGYPPEEAVGRHFSLFYPEADRRDGLPQRVLDEARTSGRVEHSGWRVRRDGTTFWADVVITAVRDDAGMLTGFVKVTRDLTDRKRLEDERDRFLAVLAHDIKNPTSALQGFAMLLGRVDDGQRDELVTRIGSAAERIANLVDGLVEYSRLRSGRVPLAPEPVPISDFVRSVGESSGLAMDRHEFRVDDSDIVVLADRPALERVLDNLLGNAAKYSPDGTPIRVSVSEHDGHARIAIADQGRGIDPADLPTIFNEFERGRLATSDGGIGLGLSSVRSLIAQQSGEVWIDSAPGVGTTVTFTLPLASRGQRQTDSGPLDV